VNKAAACPADCFSFFFFVCLFDPVVYHSSVLLQDLFRKSPLKEIKVNFSDNLTLKVREHLPSSASPQIESRQVAFKKSSGSGKGRSDSDWHLTPTAADRAEVKVAPGLAPDFIKACQKRAEKRRALAEKRKRAEAEERRRRNAEREAEREEERRQRLAEKKRAKVEAKAQAAAQEAAGHSARGSSAAPSSSSSSSSRSKIASRPSAPVAPSAPPCATCGCDSFVANMFKKGSCNSCYHKHE
jgi:hypothetical protein